jgi:hypothetical protein
MEGIDAAWSRPTPQQMTAAGKRFIIGYVSRDPAKNLTRDECLAYLAAGIDVGLVWETTSQRALAGRAAGATDGAEARRQAGVLGFPASRPIYTAVDFDASTTDLTNSVGPYLDAFANAVGGRQLAGVYGGIRTVAYALDHQLVGYGWQTYAWSNGRWDPRAQLQQYRNGVQIAGHDTDLDRSTTSDYGQWSSTNGAADMTPDEMLAALKDPRVAVLMRAFPWQYDGRGIPADMSTLAVLENIRANASGLPALADAVAAANTKLDQLLMGAAGGGGDTAPVVAAIAGLRADLAAAFRAAAIPLSPPTA